jgi:serine/threonine protein phosphatase PrpC
MRVRAASRTDVGLTRHRNEDSLAIHDPLFAVADGMGGHRGGDVASALALEAFVSTALGPNGRAEVAGHPAEALAEAIKEANHRVLERGEADRELRGMGTTLTALLAEPDRLHLAHVGDSRAYLLRDGNLQQLTEDHTLVQRMVREGRLTPDQAARHPQRSILTRALGVEEDVPVDELTMDLHAGDRVLLCTDGLTSMVDRDRLHQILQEEAVTQAACIRMVEVANRAGGEVNITVILVDFSDDDGSEDSADGQATAASPDPPGGGAVPSDPDLEQSAEATIVAAPAPAAAPTTDESAPQGKPQEARSRRPIRWGRVAVLVAIVVAVAVVAFVGTRIYVDRQWYVGEANGKVAIYRGIPARPLGISLSHVRETTDIPAQQAEQLQPYKNLTDGITAGSLQSAEGIVAQIRRDLQSTGTGAAP